MARRIPPWGAGRKAPRGQRGRLSDEELGVIREVFARTPTERLARRLNRSEKSVRCAAQRIFSGTGGESWTHLEVELKRCLGAASLSDVAIRLGRSVEDIERARLTLLARATRRAPLDQDEEREFKRIYGTREDEDLRAIFERTAATIRSEARRLHLGKDKAWLRLRGREQSKMPRWRPEDVARLQEMYPDHPNTEIADVLGRSVKSVVSKAHGLGLRKSDERIQQMGRENVQLRHDRK